MGICDIVIPIWNQLTYTKECLDSVFKETQAPFRLILIDNGSDQETKSYLEKIKKEHPEQVHLIRNERNLGFVPAVNQGIEAATDAYILLLNNDTQVGAGWLKEIIDVAESKADIGIVNANSNTLGCKLKKGQSIKKMVEGLKEYRGQYTELAWATGFCMLIKREVIEKIGLFDEQYGKGNFEDADFCKRAQDQGYLCVCALAAYVWHRERSSFMQMEKFDDLFERNRRIFHQRWGKTKRILYVLSKNEPRHKEELGARALKLARQGNVVWFFFKGLDGQQLKRHSNIYVYNIPAAFFALISLWRIVKRKKKFDEIYVDDESYGNRLKKFKLFHKSKVVYGK